MVTSMALVRVPQQPLDLAEQRPRLEAALLQALRARREGAVARGKIGRGTGAVGN